MTTELRQQQGMVMSTDIKRDLVLPPGTYAYMQDVTKGGIKTYTGPTVINPTAQEIPVIYDHSRCLFPKAPSLEQALCVFPLAPEGFYIILRNPTKDNIHPNEGSSQVSTELLTGRTINVPGPASFALWPGQVAEVVQGHHLRSNQYLLVRVYNEDEAKKNWSKAVVKKADGSDSSVDDNVPTELSLGKLLIIKGTKVSFYIPPTGIEVVRDDDGDYVRDALTLERLEYSILVDENGKKRFEIGPQVVFPLPTERFIENKDDNGRMARKFRAIELNEIQGLHIKVIAPYTENGRDYKVGEELFITGKDTSIYFPREEHSAIKYDGKTKHFATAIPVGEARYVMNRLTGAITMVKGPAMLLPDPRVEVIVRRVLSDRQCEMWYPGNIEALEYNRALRSMLASVPTTRQGAISEGDFERNSRSLSNKGQTVVTNSQSSAFVSTSNAPTVSAVRGVGKSSLMESSKVSGDQNIALDEFTRSANYSSPRTLTLDTKFQGVPSVDIWNGYAALVVSKTGKRRVERGPCTVLMEYDETLEILELSTGKPKTTDHLLRTPFLQVLNNKVSDIVEAETSDHVKVRIYISNHVNFVGNDPSRWFQVDNYVKFLCDHVRSILKGQIQKIRIEEFYANSTDLVRDFILGQPSEKKNVRPGLSFEQCAMHVSDVEVLSVQLLDDKIRALLDYAQHDVVKTHLEISGLKRALQLSKDKEEIARESAITQAETKRQQFLLAQTLNREAALTELVTIESELKKVMEQAKVTSASEENKNLMFKAELDRAQAKKEQDEKFALAELARKKEQLQAETEAAVTRFASAQTGFSEALLALSNNETLVQVAKAWDTQKIIAGESLADTMDRIFKGTPLKGLVSKLGHTSNGDSSKPVLAGPKGKLPD